MTKEEAKAVQDKIVSDGYKLDYWYGVNCEKCCGVYPKFRTYGDIAGHSKCYYECEVCGKRTKPVEMPWIAEEAWNNGEFISEQIRLF